MTRYPARRALVEALGNWRRHAGALAIVVAVFAIAAVFDTKIAYYGAALVTFSVWMAWFVLTVIDWVRLADF